MNGSGLVAGHVQMDASEVKVTVKRAEHPNLPDDTWFLSLSVTGGYCTLSGTLEHLDKLADRIGRAVDEA